MTIIRDRKDRTVNLQCDDCPSVFEGEPHESFQAMFGRARLEGWRAHTVNEEWQHRCKGCAA